MSDREEWVAAVADEIAADPDQWYEALDTAGGENWSEACEIVRLLGTLDQRSPDTNTLTDLIERAAALVSRVAIQEADMAWNSR